MRKFDLEDYEFCRCTKEERGQPWEPRWGRDDAAAGRCQPIQIGKRRNDVEWPPAPTVPSDDEADGSDTVELLPDDMFTHEFEQYRANPTAYKAANPPALVVKLLATCEERRARKQADKPAWLEADRLTPEVLATLSSDDIKRRIIHRVQQQQQGKGQDE